MSSNVPREVDQRTLDAIRAEGDDLSAIREVKFWLYLWSEHDANMVAIDCLGAGYSANVMELTGEEDEYPWQCTAWLDTSLSIEIIRHHGKVMSKIADQFHGDYGGWEAMVIASES